MKSLLKLLTAIAVMLGGMALVAPTANADTNITVTSTATSTGSTSVTETAQTTVNGATQLLWWFPNHNIKVTTKAVKKAPRIKVRYVGCAKQSKWIAKKTHGASIVVAKPGSQMCNTGKEGHIVGGFVWTVPQGRPAVLKWNKSLRLYQHVYNIVGGSLVKTCGNHIGGHVDHMFTQVIQVQFPGDLQFSSVVHADAAANAVAHASGTCPDGTAVDVSASASSSASASALVEYQLKFQATVLTSKRASMLAQVKASAEAKAEASAEAKISVTCGTTPPPPPTYEAPTISVNPGACVNQGETTGIVTVVVTNPNNSASPADVTVGSTTKHVDSIAAGSSATLTFSGFGPGTYGVTAVLTAFNKSASTSVTVAKCDVPPPPVDHAPQISCVFPAHVFVGGNVYLWCEALDSDGDALSVNIIGDQYAHVSGVIPSSVRWDGTACPTGTSCYRATLWGDQVGTSHVVATVTANGKSATSTGDVPIMADQF